MYFTGRGKNDLGGHTVSVVRAGACVYYYAHLDSYAAKLVEGDQVDTGNCPRLCWYDWQAKGGPPFLASILDREQLIRFLFLKTSEVNATRHIWIVFRRNDCFASNAPLKLSGTVIANDWLLVGFCRDNPALVAGSADALPRLYVKGTRECRVVGQVLAC